MTFTVDHIGASLVGMGVVFAGGRVRPEPRRAPSGPVPATAVIEGFGALLLGSEVRAS